ncbi:dihydrolipoyl dehydrogenase family protein [Spirulina major]|uniref:dihydrolipoyl dehydrogenase family protein n=1 Tax=Spirulina major TaxID=270636 RepID=UPI00093411BC|nr:mercuric reductase [Spirulina major]
MAVDYDLVIIGGGSGGLVVASAAAQLNAKVALVEKDKLGGDCLWHGCVPSKSLIHAARVAYDTRHGSRFGVYADPPRINFREAMGHVHNVIQTIEPHDSPERFRGLGVEVIFGSGQFCDRTTFEVNGRRLTARAFVISTGSRPAIPPVDGLTEAGFITNEQVFALTECPKTLALIGAGPIGCELGQALHRLGSKVTILSSRDRILPKEDPDAAIVVEKQLESEGIRILNNTRAEKVRIIDGKKHIWAAGEEIIVDEILVSAGRLPNVDSLNLAAAGVAYDKTGVNVDAALRTSNPRIYACGDVIGGYQFTHVAGYEAVYVLTNALFSPIKKFFPSKINYRVIPWATFTDPELARVGLSEQQARDRYGDDITILKQPFSGVDRAQAEGSTDGFCKIITRKNGEILGAHMVGPMAGELIHEIVLAMANNLPVAKLTGIHIYPTLAEVTSKTALLHQKQRYAQQTGLQNFLCNLFTFFRRF